MDVFAHALQILHEHDRATAADREKEHLVYTAQVVVKMAALVAVRKRVIRSFERLASVSIDAANAFTALSAAAEKQKKNPATRSERERAAGERREERS